MASIVPETATRLQATVFVDNAELSRLNRSEILKMAAENMAEEALRKIIKDCVVSEGDYMGHRGQTLKLDVYILTPQDLHKVIVQAREEGRMDSMRWASFDK